MMKRRIAATLTFIMALVLTTSIFFPPRGFARDAELTPQMQLALTNEQELAETLPGTDWNEDSVAEAAARIASFPDQAACELLWLFASAPPEVGRAPVFAGALSSVSPRVRTTALILLIGDGGEDAMKMADNALAAEKDPEVIRAAAEAGNTREAR